MKTLSRIGAILLVLAVSLSLLVLIRGNSTYGESSSFGVSPHTTQSESFFWFPRNLRLQISAGTEINLKLTDPSGTELLDIENIKQGLYTLSLNMRGIYKISIYNPSNAATSIRLDTTLYDFEKDLIQASIILGASGVVIMVASRVFYTFKHRQLKATKH